MDTGRDGVARSTGRFLAGLLCGLAVSACEFQSSAPPRAPESRAEYFVARLIHDPQAVDELRSVARLAEGASPDSLVSDLPTHTALNYLRARQRLGAKFGLHVASTKRTAADSRVVSVVVSEGATALSEGTTVNFQVEMQKQEDSWLVTHLRSN
jgi:hypothetical protein